jgi:hypothetical protein
MRERVMERVAHAHRVADEVVAPELLRIDDRGDVTRLRSDGPSRVRRRALATTANADRDQRAVAESVDQCGGVLVLGGAISHARHEHHRQADPRELGTRCARHRARRSAAPRSWRRGDRATREQDRDQEQPHVSTTTIRDEMAPSVVDRAAWSRSRF